MMMNPIYERERKSGSRSVRFPAVLTTFNIFLASSALAAMWVTIHRVAETGELRYSVFLSMFSRLAWLEFAASAVMMPAITSGSITGEREKKTLELVLTTRMTPAEIILGKLLSALSGVAVLLLTGTPVFAAVLLFGGVRPRDLALLYLLILLTACFLCAAGCAGDPAGLRFRQGGPDSDRAEQRCFIAPDRGRAPGEDPSFPGASSRRMCGARSSLRRVSHRRRGENFTASSQTPPSGGFLIFIRSDRIEPAE